MLQETQRMSAPSAASVSISTAVWIVMCSEPAIRAPFSGCFGAVFLARRHQARHFGLGQRDFLAAEFGERDVLDDVVGKGRLLGGGGHAVDPLVIPWRDVIWSIEYQSKLVALRHGLLSRPALRGERVGVRGISAGTICWRAPLARREEAATSPRTRGEVSKITPPYAARRRGRSSPRRSRRPFPARGRNGRKRRCGGRSAG